MNYALAFANALAEGRTLALPAALVDVQRRAQFLHEIDDLLMHGATPEDQIFSFGRRLRFLAEASEPVMSDVSDPLDRISIALRLWAGCVAAGKTIADKTKSGPNTAEERARLFPGIDGVAAQDELFRAGVEAAPTWKKTVRGQDYFLDGVPADSPVRRYTP